MTIGLGSLALICLAWWPLAMLLSLLPLSPDRQRHIGRRTIYHGLRFYLWLLRVACIIDCDGRAVESLRAETRLIVVANHPSLLDAVILLASLPNAVCVMKAALQENPMYGAATRLAHYISNSSALAMMHGACSELARDEGAHLVIFPEGTRTTQFPVNACGPSSALIAKRAQVPVQVVHIDMTSPYLGKNWGLFRPPQLPLVCRLRLGPRYLPDADVRALTEKIERDLAQCEIG